MAFPGSAWERAKRGKRREEREEIKDNTGKRID
jgi:hypothetical protein